MDTTKPKPANTNLEQLKQEILGYSEELTERGEGAPGRRHGGDTFLHIFVVGGDGYMIPAGAPAVMVQAGSVRRLPFSTPWFEGLIHYRGDLAPLFDLSRFYAPNGDRSKGRYMLVVGHGDDKAALRVEEVSTVAAEAIIEETRQSEREFVVRIHNIDGKSYRELDLQGLFKAMAGRSISNQTEPA